MFHIITRVTGGELFEDIVAREYYSEADARSVLIFLKKEKSSGSSLNLINKVKINLMWYPEANYSNRS